jgi:MoxR-like ATPase
MIETEQIAPERFVEQARAIETEVGRSIIGQAELLRGVLACIFTGGHALLEGVPGLGKTATVRALGEALDVRFSRIQFTPDLMPSDITGTNVISEDERGARDFRFQPGPVFASLVLADEINRATPKTQSALLEAMQERAVTVGNTRHSLPDPFFVLATQNPIDMEGTYPLPEAQLDRFMYKLIVPFPQARDLVSILERTTGGAETRLRKVGDAAAVRAMAGLARSVPIAPHVLEHAAELVLMTHPEHPRAPELVRRYVRFGASPRGAQALVLGAKVNAVLDGRYNAAIEDVNDVALPALRHRVIRNYEGESEGVTPDRIVSEAVAALTAAASRL